MPFFKDLLAQTQNIQTYPMDAKDGNVDKESCLNTPQPLGISGHRLARSPGSKDATATDVLNIVQLQRAITKGHKSYVLPSRSLT